MCAPEEGCWPKGTQVELQRAARRFSRELHELPSQGCVLGPNYQACKSQLFNFQEFYKLVIKYRHYEKFNFILLYLFFYAFYKVFCHVSVLPISLFLSTITEWDGGDAL